MKQVLDEPLSPLSGAFVNLVGDTVAIDRRVTIRGDTVDRAGRLRWDSLPTGRYGLLVRRVGYEILRRPVDARSGAADALVIKLRTQPMCHAP